MSITFPTFIDKEIVTPEKLNDFVQALEAKFAAGLSSAEIIWPLIAAGDIQMGDHNITGGKTIWDIYNAKQYGDDWDACLLAAGPDGCIVIPPDTTVTMDASAMAGTSLTIKGSGPSSILQLEAGATGDYALRNSTAGFSFQLENLTVDGADIGSNRGIILQGAEDVTIHNVLFSDFPLSSLYFTSTGGVGCSRVKITDCEFEGGADYQIEGDDIADLVIKGNNFKTAAKTAIMLEASGSTADMLRLEIEGNNFFGCTGDVISVLGADGSYNAPQSHVRVSGNKANNLNGIKVGATDNKLQYVVVSDNIMPSSAADGLAVCAKYGTVRGNVAPGATDSGLDLLASVDLVVVGNDLNDCGAWGINAATSTDCYIRENNMANTNDGELKIPTSLTAPGTYECGDLAIPGGPVDSLAKASGATLVIPAYTFRAVGDGIHVYHSANDGVAGGTLTASFDGDTVFTLNMSGSTGIVSSEIHAVCTAMTDNGTGTFRVMGNGFTATKNDDKGTGQDTSVIVDCTAAFNISVGGADSTQLGILGTLFKSKVL